VLAALVLVGIFVPLRMQCAAASGSVCRLDGLRHLFSPKTAFAPVGARTGQDTAAQTDFEAVWAAQPRVSLNVEADNAKVVIVAFADWQCPACKAMHQAYAPLLETFEREHPGAVRLVHKDFPLNPACNSMLPSSFPGHAAACEAAVAVRLAREQGRADAMAAWLFANQEGLTPAGVKEALVEITGISDFDARYAEQIEHVRADVAEAATLGVSSTPTCYVNGIKANTADGRWLPVDYMRVAINHELAVAARR
jgi:protein-disulfide isomerase